MVEIAEWRWVRKRGVGLARGRGLAPAQGQGARSAVELGYETVRWWTGLGTRRWVTLEGVPAFEVAVE